MKEFFYEYFEEVVISIMAVVCICISIHFISLMHKEERIAKSTIASLEAKGMSKVEYHNFWGTVTYSFYTPEGKFCWVGEDCISSYTD